MPQPIPEEVETDDILPQPVAFDESPLGGQASFDPDPEHRPLYGKHVLITAGPTREPIDPVRYIANRSSGKQGFALAAMAASAGARVTLIAGPVHLPTPVGVDRIDVETAEDMAEEVRNALPVDIAFMVAAVADWKSKHVAGEKMKKRGSAPPALILAENPDILASTAAGRKRPTLLIGFAAETENVVENAKTKRKRKGGGLDHRQQCDRGRGRKRDGRRSEPGPHRYLRRCREPARNAEGRRCARTCAACSRSAQSGRG